MDIKKVLLNGDEIPVFEGTFRLSSIGRDESLEVELNVHPTVISFAETLNYTEEKITIITSDNDTIIGTFEILTGNSSILLVGNPKIVEGIDKISFEQKENRNASVELQEYKALDKELKLNQKNILINIIQSLLEDEIQDKGNRMFINTMLKKILNGEKLNSFEQYIKNEISYFIEEVMTKKIL
ncbi:hypothetical protein [Neobacillus terrae]|uniref:hypothetical protein n=1 Tax=Neobacillus terrae TaxID=3034837 RepID=UPI00140C5F7B|nr:hypothetical protein [Neobacillus terrae]NHM30742.1 hypothetical protein [Neobacillus terrae]